MQVEGGSPSLYCLRDAKDESDPFDCPRFFTPLVNRTVRFLLHAALVTLLVLCILLVFVLLLLFLFRCFFLALLT